MKTTISLLMVMLLTAMLCGCSTTNKSKAATTPDAAGVGGQVEEIMPGMLQGYLDTGAATGQQGVRAAFAG